MAGKVLDVSYRGNVIYELVEIKKEDGSIVKIINTIRIHRNLRRGEIGYKYESEDMGPISINCPLRLLKASTSTNEYAVKWRESCLQKISEKRKMRRVSMA